MIKFLILLVVLTTNSAIAQIPQKQGGTGASSFCGSLSGAAGCILINVAGTNRYIPYW